MKSPNKEQSDPPPLLNPSQDLQDTDLSECPEMPVLSPVSAEENFEDVSASSFLSLKSKQQTFSKRIARKSLPFQGYYAYMIGKRLKKKYTKNCGKAYSVQNSDLVVIDGIEFRSFETQKDLDEFCVRTKSRTLDIQDAWAKYCEFDKSGDLSGLEKFLERRITPTKTTDITKIKGWKNKLFTRKYLNGSTYLTDRYSTKRQLKSFDIKTQVNELNMNNQERQELDAEAVPTSVGFAKSAFVSESLDEFLKSKSELRMDLAVKAENSISKVPPKVVWPSNQPSNKQLSKQKKSSILDSSKATSVVSLGPSNELKPRATIARCSSALQSVSCSNENFKLVTITSDHAVLASEAVLFYVKIIKGKSECPQSPPNLTDCANKSISQNKRLSNDSENDLTDNPIIEKPLIYFSSNTSSSEISQLLDLSISEDMARHAVSAVVSRSNPSQRFSRLSRKKIAKASKFKTRQGSGQTFSNTSLYSTELVGDVVVSPKPPFATALPVSPVKPDSNNKIVTDRTVNKEDCGQEFCKLGCVCDSLKTRKRVRNHCCKPQCMFICSCDGFLPISRKGIMAKKMGLLSSMTSSDGKTIESDEPPAKRRRQTRLPARLQDSVFLWNDKRDFADFENEEKSPPPPKSKGRQRTYMKELQDQTHVDLESNYLSPKRQPENRKLGPALSYPRLMSAKKIPLTTSTKDNMNSRSNVLLKSKINVNNLKSSSSSYSGNPNKVLAVFKGQRESFVAPSCGIALKEVQKNKDFNKIQFSQIKSQLVKSQVSSLGSVDGQNFCDESGNSKPVNLIIVYTGIDRDHMAFTCSNKGDVNSEFMIESSADCVLEWDSAVCKEDVKNKILNGDNVLGQKLNPPLVLQSRSPGTARKSISVSSQKPENLFRNGTSTLSSTVLNIGAVGAVSSNCSQIIRNKNDATERTFPKLVTVSKEGRYVLMQANKLHVPCGFLPVKNSSNTNKVASLPTITTRVIPSTSLKSLSNSSVLSQKNNFVNILPRTGMQVESTSESNINRSSELPKEEISSSEHYTIKSEDNTPCNTSDDSSFSDSDSSALGWQAVGSRSTNEIKSRRERKRRSEIAQRLHQLLIEVSDKQSLRRWVDKVEQWPSKSAILSMAMSTISTAKEKEKRLIQVKSELTAKRMKLFRTFTSSLKGMEVIFQKGCVKGLIRSLQECCKKTKEDADKISKIRVRKADVSDLSKTETIRPLLIAVNDFDHIVDTEKRPSRSETSSKDSLENIADATESIDVKSFTVKIETNDVPKCAPKMKEMNGSVADVKHDKSIEKIKAIESMRSPSPHYFDLECEEVDEDNYADVCNSSNSSSDKKTSFGNEIPLDEEPLGVPKIIASRSISEAEFFDKESAAGRLMTY